MKVGLLTSNSLSDFRLKTIDPIINDKLFTVELAIIDDRPEKSLTEKLRSNIKRRRGAYIFILALKSLLRRKNKAVQTKEYCQKNNIKFLETRDPYSWEIIDQIKHHNLDVLLLIGGYGIVKEPLLSAAPLGVLSYHHGNMRKYRGFPPALWELYNNEKEMGVTVQILTAGLDCGIPIEEKTIEIRPTDNLKKLTDRAFIESEDMMYAALKKLCNPEFRPATIETFGQVYTLPNFREWMVLNAKILRRGIKSYF